jgi:hypothetical protein
MKTQQINKIIRFMPQSQLKIQTKKRKHKVDNRETFEENSYLK